MKVLDANEKLVQSLEQEKRDTKNELNEAWGEFQKVEEELAAECAKFATLTGVLTHPDNEFFSVVKSHFCCRSC